MKMNIEFPGGARVDARTDGFIIHTDQPADHGGDNSAPAPFDLFLASIGTCAGYFALRFLQQRGLPTEGMHLSLDTERDEDEHRVRRIALDLELPPSFPAKYEGAIVRAMNQCSVKQHLARAPEITTETHRPEAA